MEYLRELHRHYYQNNLSFEFAALDFTDPAQNRYRYQLVGLDADWVETGSVRFAHFTHLAPGSCQFRVQGPAHLPSDGGECALIRGFIHCAYAEQVFLISGVVTGELL